MYRISSNQPRDDHTWVVHSTPTGLGVAFTANQTRKCSQDTRRGDFHTLFRNHNVVLQSDTKHFRVLYLFIQSYRQKVLAFFHLETKTVQGNGGGSSSEMTESGSSE